MGGEENRVGAAVLRPSPGNKHRACDDVDINHAATMIVVIDREKLVQGDAFGTTIKLDHDDHHPDIAIAGGGFDDAVDGALHSVSLAGGASGEAKTGDANLLSSSGVVHRAA